MVTCDLCGGNEFEKHEGFMYCATCQTQSQHYYEQEYDYQNHEINISRKLKSAESQKKSKVEKVCDDGLWTTWEAFNYILHGMTEEVKKCGASQKVGEMVLKLWAAYLRECTAAFTSKYQEKIPKLGFGFRNRDAKILYNVDLTRKRSAKSRTSRASDTSDTSLQSKRSIAIKKRKLIAAEYQDYLSLSGQNNTSLADETLESLGKSSEFDTSEDSSESIEAQIKSLKNVFIKKDYKLYKDLHGSKSCMRATRNNLKVGLRCLGKNKLLSIIHLALLMCGSPIQLGDLLRFIRESHLSFAKVTHFFPKGMKLPKRDLNYIEIVTDHIMPTHFAQRKILGKLALFLRVEEIPTPDIAALIDRYCLDLNLPKQVAEFGKKITADYIPVRYKMFESNYEAWAMASVIIALKFFLGINDKTEFFLSDLALEINNLGSSEDSLFVFQDWQKFIECRKTVLINFHYPTEEQLGGSPFQGCKNFLGILMKESKDEHRSDRFIRYPRYYMNEEFLKATKEILNSLSKPQKIAQFDFRPSLTPQVSNLETIMRELSKGAVGEDDKPSISKTSLPENTLQQDFKNCDIKFALDPKNYLNLLGKNPESFRKFGINEESMDDSFQEKKVNLEFLFDCQSRYWIARYPETLYCNLNQFNDQVLNKTPENFQWLIKECSRMLEMNVRDLYLELLRLEVSLISKIL